MIPVKPDVPGRLWPRAHRADSGCWEWTGGTNSRGYGVISISGVVYLTHRVAFQIATGTDPDGMTVDHRCRNKLCMNPEHLELVTNAENNRRRGLAAKSTPAYPCGHPRSPLNTLTRTRGNDECRACNRDRQARARQLVTA